MNDFFNSMMGKKDEEQKVSLMEQLAPVAQDAPVVERTVDNTYGGLANPRTEQHTPNLIDIESLLKSSPEDKLAQEAREKSSLDRLSQLQDSYKKEIEDAKSRQFKAEAFAAVGNYLPKAIAGATAMNTKANVQAPDLPLIKVDDQTAGVRAKYKTDYEGLMDQYKSIMKDGGKGMDIKTRANLLTANMQSRNQSDRMNANKETVDRQLTKAVGRDQITEQKDNELSDKQTENVAGFKKILTRLDEIREMKKTKDTGPIANLRNKLAGKVGMDDPEVTAFRAKTIKTLNEEIKRLSGTAAANSEVARIEVTLPEFGMNDDTFNKMVDETQNDIRNALAADAKAQKDLQGKNVGGYTDVSAKVGAPARTPQSSISPQDQAALNWATSNSSDPRAAAILQKLGR